MKRKVIKLTEAQANQIINEDFPFAYMGTESSEVNHGDEISAEGPNKIDSPDIDPDPITGDQVGKTLSNNSWWNRSYGFNGYR